MKSTPTGAPTAALVLTVAALLAACETGSKKAAVDGNPANAPVVPAEVTPPQCGIAPPLPKSFRDNPGFKGASLVVGFNLAPSGELSAIRIDRSSGHSALDAAALAQVKQWRCPSASRRTIVLPAQVLLEFKPWVPEQSDDGRR
jgi:TonB family protein